MTPEEAHLYSDPDLYEAQTAALTDIPFWIELAARHDWERVVELGCGTGRIGIHLQHAVREYWGVDSSRTFLDYFRSRMAEGGGPRLVEADFTAFHLPETSFDAVIMPFNALVHVHSVETLRSLLWSVAGHLRRDGTFVVDLFNPSLELLSRPPNNQVCTAEFTGPDGCLVRLLESHEYDRAEQVNRVNWTFVNGDVAVQRSSLVQRIYWPQELRRAVEANGFDILTTYGDYGFGRFASESPKQILICRLRGR
jgi:SAM-dependent methyltransferase